MITSRFYLIEGSSGCESKHMAMAVAHEGETTLPIIILKKN